MKISLSNVSALATPTPDEAALLDLIETFAKNEILADRRGVTVSLMREIYRDQKTKQLCDALEDMISFAEGFEDDETQEGLTKRIKEARAALS